MTATFEIIGMVHETYTYTAPTPTDIIDCLMNDQDLYSLMSMGSQFGEDLSDLKRFITKYKTGVLTAEDIRNFDIELSIGTVKCVVCEG